VLAAQDVMTFTQALSLSGRLRVAEPKTLRHLLHTPGRITRSARRVTLHIQHDWPTAAELVDAYQRLRTALPVPAD